MLHQPTGDGGRGTNCRFENAPRTGLAPHPCRFIRARPRLAGGCLTLSLNAEDNPPDPVIRTLHA